jgi:uncharacterized GH25 family protein
LIVVKRIALTAAALSIAGVLHAHDFWIQPSTFHPDPGSTVKVALRVGQNFTGDPVPRVSRFIDQFILRQAGHDEEINGIENSDPAGFLHADGQATAVIAYSTLGTDIELPAAKFEAYLRQEGLEEVIAQRAKNGDSAKPGEERFFRYAKALLTGKRTSPAATQPIGFRYEIVPADDPTVHPPAPFRARVLYKGKPLAGALVVAMHRGTLSVKIKTRTDRHGAFSLNLPAPGVWLIKSVHMIRPSFFSFSSADWESLWASLTFDAPGR